MASKMVYVNELVTVDMIARRFKVSVGQVTNIVKGRDSKKTNFPAPIVGWGCRGVWLLEDVEEWFKTHNTKIQAREERKALRKSQSKGYVNRPAA